MVMVMEVRRTVLGGGVDENRLEAVTVAFGAVRFRTGGGDGGRVGGGGRL